MARITKTAVETTPIERMRRNHHYALTMLYQAQAGRTPNGRGEDYWHGVVTGLEAGMDILGIDHETFNPFGYMDYTEEVG